MKCLFFSFSQCIILFFWIVKLLLTPQNTLIQYSLLFSLYIFIEKLKWDFAQLVWVHVIIIWKLIFDPPESVAFSIHFESLSPFVLDYLGYHLAVTMSLMNADVYTWQVLHNENVSVKLTMWGNWRCLKMHQVQRSSVGTRRHTSTRARTHTRTQLHARRFLIWPVKTH